jgi:dTDP-glucose 4,6-dehydratase
VEVSETNYVGTINLAEACYHEVPSFKQFIFAGTSEEYGMALRDKTKKISENSELQPNSPYAVAKVASDMYLKYMHSAYQFPYTILRPFNTYGRTDNTHFFIERTITQMLNADTVHLGDSEAIRDWLYVDDHVDGYLKSLGNKKAIGEEIQLCTGKGYTTKETAELIATLTGFKGKIIWNSTPKRPLDAPILIGDNSKAKRLLSWEPKYTLTEGLAKTINYWKSVKTNSN